MDAPPGGAGFGTMTPEVSGAEGYYDWLADTLKPKAGRRVLEIGPGYGNLAERFEGVELYVGLDAAPEIAAHLRRRFAAKPWFEAVEDAALGAAHRAKLKARRFDTLLAVNVLEHLPDDGAALALWSELAPGARLLLFVPALPALYGTLDAQAGHFRRYTRSGLSELLQARGVELESVRYFNAVGALGWFVSGRVLRQDLASPQAGRLVKIYERWVLPVARRVDPLLRPLWGQSLVAIGRLPGTQRA